MKRIFLAAVLLATLATLAACGSSVKLDTPPVEDRTGTQVATGTVGSGATPTGQSGVTAVDLVQSSPNGIGPVGAVHVVYFDYDSFAVKPEFQAVIETHARFLQANKGRKANLEGHTDERGGREYNLALGQKRAEAVRRALALLGVSDSQIEAVSFGKEKPADSGAGEAAFAKNRRVELKYR